MADTRRLNNKIKSLEKQKSFGCAMFYKESSERHIEKIALLETINKLNENLSVELPEHITAELKELLKKTREEVSCPICLDTINPDNLKWSSCGHRYCGDCLKQLIDNSTEPSCAICRKRLYKKKN